MATTLALLGRKGKRPGSASRRTASRIANAKAAAIGRKAAPGPLYGISRDVWSALAIAVTYTIQGG